MGGVHGLAGERGGGVAHQGHVIAQFSSELAGGFDAGVGQHPYHDDLFHAVLLELKVQIGIGKTATAPICRDRHAAC